MDTQLIVTLEKEQIQNEIGITRYKDKLKVWLLKHYVLIIESL